MAGMFYLILQILAITTIVRCTNSMDPGVMAIVNLTNSIQQLLSQSIVSCPLPSTDKNDHRQAGLNEMVQLLLTQQILMESKTGSKSKEYNDDIKHTLDMITTKITSQGQTIDTVVKELDKLTNKMNELCNGSNVNQYLPSPLLHSCQEIKEQWPNSPSDYYMIVDANGHNKHVFCHMEKLCNSNDGWTKVTYLNMSDIDEKCPPGLREYEDNNKRACGRPEVNKGHCQSTFFSTAHVEYSEVCGRILGYQYGTPGGTNPYGHQTSYNIDSYYTEGVSLTHSSPRQHIWTFINSRNENFFETSDGRVSCPCAPNSGIRHNAPPSFVGQDYFCESGSPQKAQKGVLYTNDELWDGKQCGLIETPCCKAPSIPWFHKILPASTTDNIEMRICGNEGTDIEDSPVSLVEIYVK